MIFGYPISEQQIEILNIFGFSGSIYLWIVRIFSLLLTTVLMTQWLQVLNELNLKKSRFLITAVVVLTPLMLILILVYPLVCLKLLLFVFLLRMGLKNKYFWLIVPIILVLYNMFVLGNNPAIFNKIDFQDAKLEVTNRISSEDGVLDSIYLPISIRRITYNKFFISYKQVLGELLPYFDFETLFFGEINPMSQKSVVMFYWPYIYLFVLGIYALFVLKNKILNSFLIVTFALTWVDYVFSEGTVYLRLVLSVLPLSIVIGCGYYFLITKAIKPNMLAGVALAGVSIFVVVGMITSIQDLNKRSDYWLDNRPLAYEFWFSEIDKLNIDQYDQIYITSLVGDSKKYCYFYLGKVCNDKKFVFSSFDLTKERGKNTVYAGFGGEFVGSQFKNNIDADWSSLSSAKIINKHTLRDTIANQYGNDVGVGVIQ